MTHNAHKACFIVYILLDVMWCIFLNIFLNEISTVVMLRDSCSTMPMLTRLAFLLEWQQCQQSQCVCVSLPRGTGPARTDTAMCSDGLTQRWEQLSERASVVVKANRHGTRNHMFGYIFLYRAAGRTWNMPGARGPVDGTVTSASCPRVCCMKGEGGYITIMRHVSHAFPLKLVNRLVWTKAEH